MDRQTHIKLVDAAQSAPCNGCRYEPVCGREGWTCPRYRRWMVYGSARSRNSVQLANLSQIADETLNGDLIYHD